MKDQTSLKLEDSISLTFKILEQLSNTNDLDAAVNDCDEYSLTDIYHSYLKTNLLVFKSLLTYHENDLEQALQSALKTSSLSNRYRRKGIFCSLLKLIRTPNYDCYSDEEVHAELIYAASLAFHGTLSLLTRAYTLRDMVTIFKTLRQSKKSYKECRVIMRNRTEWQSDTSRVNFEAAVCLERGFRHLLISYFPPKLWSLAKFLGYRGCRDVAYSELTKTAYKLYGMFSRFAEIVLLSYNLFFEPVGSCGRRRLDVCDVILNKRLKTHPNCIAFKLFKAKFSQLNGEFDTAIEEFEQTLTIDRPMFHMIAQWELMWSHALRCEYEQCIKYAQDLRAETLHSPIISTYCEAVFKYYQAYKSGDDKLKKEASDLFRIIPTISPRYIGKVITFEKECLESANDYIKNKEYLFLPVMSMLYEGNFFYLIDGNVPLLEKHLEIVEEEMQIYLKRNENANYADYYLDSLFYKGVLKKHMRGLIEAQHCFNTILNEMDTISTTRSLIPQTLMELGLIQAMLSNKDDAKKFFQKALKHFSGYRSESLVQIRIHSAILDLDSNIAMEHNNNNDLEIVEEYARRVSELTHKI